MTKPIKFELDTSEYKVNYYEICWICKHRKKCPMDWECETIADLDNDDTDDGDDQA